MTTAAEQWDELHSKRSGVLQRARDCAELTHPVMLPPEGHSEDEELPTPRQSLGARGVNHLASKLLISLFPMGTSFVRFKLAEAVSAALGEKKVKVEEAMRRLENKGMDRMSKGRLRACLYNAIRYIIVTGNALLHIPTKGEPRCYRMDQYVVMRDPRGDVLKIIIKEKVHVASLDDDVKEACEITTPTGEGDKAESDIDLYTIVCKDGKRFKWHQELNEKKVPGSEGRTKADLNPYIALRWNDNVGEDYGRGLVEEYLGDLRSLEALSKAIVEFSAVAAKIVVLVKPNAATDPDELEDAESGDIVEGDPNDVNILQLDKYADFRVAKSVVDELSLRLSHAFLLRGGVTRDAERVTAEEIRQVAQELEEALGGVYTIQTNDFQLPVAKRLVAQMKAAKEFPSLPDGKAIELTIITGFAALGRGHELNRMRAFLADAQQLFGPQVLQRLNISEGLMTLATAHNVDAESLIKTDDQVMAEQEQAQMAQLGGEMMSNAVKGAAGPVAAAAAENLKPTEE